MFRELPGTLRLAVPLIIGQVSQMLMGWADTLMIARLGLDALAACAFANNVFSVPLVIGLGLLSAVIVKCAHAFGSTDHVAAGNFLQTGLILALLFSLPAALIFIFNPLWAGHLGQPPEVTAAAAEYLVPLGWSMIPALLAMVLKSFSEALSRPWLPFWVLTSAVGLNVFLNWVLIFGNLGAPQMGLEGAGWATLISRVVGFLVLLFLMMSSPAHRFWLPAIWLARGVRVRMRELLTIGLPVGGQLAAEVSAFAFAGLMMGWIGEMAMAAHQIAITCAATTFMVPLGLSMALTVRIGHAHGGREPERIRPLFNGAMLVGVGLMSVFASVFLLAGPSIAGWFVEGGPVLTLAASMLAVAGIFQLADGAQVVTLGALRGLGDVQVPMWIAASSYWLVALPLGYWLAFSLSMGALGVWLGLALGLFVAAGLVMLRFSKLAPRVPGKA